MKSNIYLFLLLWSSDKVFEIFLHEFSTQAIACRHSMLRPSETQNKGIFLKYNQWIIIKQGILIYSYYLLPCLSFAPMICKSFRTQGSITAFVSPCWVLNVAPIGSLSPWTAPNPFWKLTPMVCWMLNVKY